MSDELKMCPIVNCGNISCDAGQHPITTERPTPKEFRDSYNTGQRNTQRKAPECRAFKSGSCKWGNSCKYRHVGQPSSRTPTRESVKSLENKLIHAKLTEALKKCDEASRKKLIAGVTNLIDAQE